MEFFGKFIIFKNQPRYSIFEIVPPHDTKQTPLATEQFFTTLHSLGRQRTFFEKLIGKKKLFAFEVVSTKEQGIRYVIRVANDDVHIIKKHLLSFLPGIRINPITDYLPERLEKNTFQCKTVTLRLSRNFLYPLQEQTHLSQHDPIAYLTGQMTKLKQNELITIQYILTPTNRVLENQFSFSSVISFLFNCFTFLILTPFTLLGWLMFNDNKESLPWWVFQKKNQKKEEISLKTQHELFETTIRICVITTTEQEQKTRMKGLRTSFATFHNDGQELRVKKLFPFILNRPISKQLFFIQLKHRLLSLTSNPILSASELASLFHFPYTPTMQTEDLVTSKYNQLPAPLSLKKEKHDLDIVFANNSYAETVTPIGLTREERRRHMYILGATGMGKTTLLSSMIREDIANGKGVCVIDPHGNLIDQILPIIPKDRVKDVILFDPDDTEYPIGLNLLSLPKNIPTNELQRQKEFVTSNLISIIIKLYPPRFTGPRMEYILRNTILTALETEQPTLFTIQQLLVDATYRKKIVATLTNPMLKLFWTKEFAQMGSFQKSDATAPITNKIGKFLTSSLAANILGQKETKLNFSESMDTGKILLCDLSKGKIGEDFSSMFGSLITAGVQLAAMKRARMPENQRRDFYLYIDEFQNFATNSFAQVMSEARKYRLNAILAHQTIAQIEAHDLVKVILANTGSIVSFRTGSPLDEEFILPFFTPKVSKGEIANLPPYHFYLKINGDIPQDCFSGETINQEIPQDEKVIDQIRNHSRKEYASSRGKIEQEIQALFLPQILTTKKAIETKKGQKRILPEEQLQF